MIKGKVLVGFGDASADIYPKPPGSEVCACTKSIKSRALQIKMLAFTFHSSVDGVRNRRR